MNPWIRIAAAAALLSSCSLALASPVAGLGGFDKRECQAFAEVFFRIAAMRDAGAGKGLAIDEGVTFLERLGTTGTHIKHDYRPRAQRFADYVYARRDFEPAILFVHGLYHCALTRTQPDDAALERGLQQLDRVTRSCKSRHKAREQVQQLGNCIEVGMEGTAGEKAPPER